MEGGEKKTYAERLEQVLGLLVDVELAALAGAKVEGRDLGDVLILALTLLFLELEGDAADGTALDALHQVGGETGDLWVGELGLVMGELLRRYRRTLFLRRLEAMIAISSQIRLLVSKSRVSLG